MRAHGGGGNSSLAKVWERDPENLPLRGWTCMAAGLLQQHGCACEARRGFAGNERWRTLSAPREFGQPVDSPPFGEYSRVAGADLPGFIARQRSIRRTACDQNLHGLRLRWAGPIAGHVARTVPGAYVKVIPMSASPGKRRFARIDRLPPTSSTSRPSSNSPRAGAAKTSST